MKNRLDHVSTCAPVIIAVLLLTGIYRSQGFALTQQSAPTDSSADTIQPSPRVIGPDPRELGDKETELHKAAREGDLELLQLRLHQGVPPDARNPEGRTALLEAAATGKTQIVRVLLSAGAGINAASPEGRTPLIEAAENGSADVAPLLIKAGADLNLRSRSGTALEIAERSGHDDIAAMLRLAGARTFGRSVGDTVCVRAWDGDGYCGNVAAIHKNDYQIRVTKIVGCTNGCSAKEECSAGRLVGGSNGLHIGEVITTVNWCLTNTGVKP